MADELIDIVNEDGSLSGGQCLKSYAHKTGIWHSSAHIWFYTSSGELLIQQRAHDKDTFPGLWDVSVAGHIGSGEQPIHSAIREVKEEIGLYITKADLKPLGKWKESHEHPNGLIDKEWHYLYLCKLIDPLENLQLQEEEVAAIRLIPMANFEQSVEEGNIGDFVPHGTDYYLHIINAIKKEM